MDVAAYLARIGLPGSARRLTRKRSGVCISLTLHTVLSKIWIYRSDTKSAAMRNAFSPQGRRLAARRFWYELNGAFAALLRTLDFRVTLLSARVAREDGSASPEFDHMALLVDLDEPWLADVGFRGFFSRAAASKNQA